MSWCDRGKLIPPLTSQATLFHLLRLCNVAMPYLAKYSGAEKQELQVFIF